MKSDLYQKKGMIVGQMANLLITMKENDRLPTFSHLQERFEVSRGTLQNALNYLKEMHAVEVQSRGQSGSYIRSINYAVLQQYCEKAYINGLMPLPYTKSYEGLATGLYKCLSGQKMKFVLSYARGSTNRYRMLMTGAFDFVISSKYSAKKAIEEGYPIEIAVDFGPGSYLTKHVVVFDADKAANLRDGLKIGIDNESLDQRHLTYKIIKPYKVELVDIVGQQFLRAIKDGRIDAGVWNYDDVIEKEYVGFNWADIENEYADECSSAVIVVKKNDDFIKSVLDTTLSIDEIISYKKMVLNNLISPVY